MLNPTMSPGHVCQCKAGFYFTFYKNGREHNSVRNYLTRQEAKDALRALFQKGVSDVSARRSHHS